YVILMLAGCTLHFTVKRKTKTAQGATDQVSEACRNSDSIKDKTPSSQLDDDPSKPEIQRADVFSRLQNACPAELVDHFKDKSYREELRQGLRSYRQQLA